MPRHCDAQRMAMARMGAVLKSMGTYSCLEYWLELGSRIGILSGWITKNVNKKCRQKKNTSVTMENRSMPAIKKGILNTLVSAGEHWFIRVDVKNNWFLCCLQSHATEVGIEHTEKRREREKPRSVKKEAPRWAEVRRQSDRAWRGHGCSVPMSYYGRIPHPPYRHAAPSAPWPWLDISDGRYSPTPIPVLLNSD